MPYVTLSEAVSTIKTVTYILKSMCTHNDYLLDQLMVSYLFSLLGMLCVGWHYMKEMVDLVGILNTHLNAGNPKVM